MTAEIPSFPRRDRLTVLGVGNVLCTDDGLGPAAVAQLNRRFKCEDRVEIADGGTLGLSLLPLLEDSDQVIIVDAIRFDQPAGTLVRLEGEDVLPAVRTRLSVHQVGVADLLDAAKLREKLPRITILLGLVPDSIELGVELSDPVRAALPRLVDAVAAEVRALGFAIEERRGDERSDDEALDNRDRAGGFFVQSVRGPRPAARVS